MVRPCRARSVDLGPGGAIGRVSFEPIDSYPGPSAGSARSAWVGENSSVEFTWVDSRRNRLRPTEIGAYVAEEGRRRRPVMFTYKRVWYSGRSFANGLFSFAFSPFLYGVIWLIINDELEYKHLSPPVRLVGEIRGLLCRIPVCACSSSPRAGSSIPNSYSPIQLRDVLPSCTD